MISDQAKGHSGHGRGHLETGCRGDRNQRDEGRRGREGGRGGAREDGEGEGRGGEQR